jgi:hypothetical protein
MVFFLGTNKLLSFVISEFESSTHDADDDQSRFEEVGGGDRPQIRRIKRNKTHRSLSSYREGQTFSLI